MRPIVTLLLLLIGLPEMMLIAHADEAAVVETANNSVKKVQGVFVEIGKQQLLKTPNETYLLVDQHHLLENLLLKNHQVLEESIHDETKVLQSFRVCLIGKIVPHTQVDLQNNYQHTLIVHQVCDIL